MWDLDLCVNYEPKQLVPFKYFIRPASLPPLEASRTFTCFANLPVEIHLQIYDFCDTPTLFQLMHTCARTRTEASKRFWSQQDIWYNCPDTSLFDYFIKHPIPLFCVSFASQITQVEIDVETLGTVFGNESVVKNGDVVYDSESSESPNNGETVEAEAHPVTTLDKARIFWKRVQTVFPSISRVVISGKPWMEENHDWFPDCDANNVDVSLAIQQAPPHISVFIATECRRKQPNDLENGHKLWQFNKQFDPPSWYQVPGFWTPKRVLLPPRQFVNYPLDTLLKIISIQSNMDLERRGLHWLTLESYPRYATTARIQCPNPMCNALLPTRKVWSQHLQETHHGRLRARCTYNENQVRCSANTPADVKAKLEARHKWIVGRQRDADKMTSQLENEWEYKGPEERRMFQTAFHEQLRNENIFAPGELVVDKCGWIELMEDVLDSVDSVHSYQF
jgi:hypothetical protein